MGINFEFKFNVKRKFIVNGKEYNSVDEMPADIRQAYERVENSSSSDTNHMGISVNPAANYKEEGITARQVTGKPIVPESSFIFSPLRLIVGLFLLSLLYAVYYLIKG